MRFSGPLYRASNTIYTREPLSGRGAELYGGRFNAKGTPALYAALDVMTAIREANQVGALQPTTLVSYDAEIEQVFDTRDTVALTAQGVDAASLTSTSWRDEMRATGLSRAQAFARQLVALGFHGLLVRSFAPGATAGDLNLVLSSWSSRVSNRLTPIDNENRLSQ